MAANIGSSNGPDLRDIAAALLAFEEQNTCRLVMTLRTMPPPATPDIWLEGKALSLPQLGQVPRLLASASVTCLAISHKSMDTAVFRLLYALDFELAQREFDTVRKPKA